MITILRFSPFITELEVDAIKQPKVNMKCNRQKNPAIMKEEKKPKVQDNTYLSLF